MAVLIDPSPPLPPILLLLALSALSATDAYECMHRVLFPMHLSNRNQNLPLLKPKSKLKQVPNRKQPSRETLSYLGRRRTAVVGEAAAL